MTVREAILTLRANAILACERAGFTSATVKMVEDALDIIDKALQAYEPRVMTLEELDDLRGRGRAVWFDDRDRSTKCKDVFFVVVKDGIAYFKGETYSMQELEDGYGKTWRCWTSRPTDELREATPWQTSNA